MLVICCASIVVVVMDVSIVNVALPAIRRDLHASVSGLQWTVDAYTLVLASFLLLAGSAADRVGRLRIFQIGLATFGLGSLLCGLAPTIGTLIAARALQAVGTALFVPESRAERARRFDPAGQALVILVLGSVVYAIIESGGLGWTSPVIDGLLGLAAVGVLGLFGYEPRRADPLLELRLFRSLPFSSAVVMALFALCGFGAFLFVTTQYLQSVRGMSALTAGLCLLPVGALTLVLAPLTGRVIGARGPRLPLVISGAALALGGCASLWLGPAAPLPAVLAIYLLFGVFLGTVNPPITNSAVSGMPRSMAGVAASLASTGRQTGTVLGVAISGSIVGSALARGGTAFVSAERGVWWLVCGLGLGISALGWLGTGRLAADTAARAAALFEAVDRGTAERDAPASGARLAGPRRRN